MISGQEFSIVNEGKSRTQNFRIEQFCDKEIRCAVLTVIILNVKSCTMTDCYNKEDGSQGYDDRPFMTMVCN
jgi:hypothetical protein